MSKATRRLWAATAQNHRLAFEEWEEIHGLKSKKLPITVRGAPCVYCGDRATTRDHIIPKSSGGTDSKRNGAPACHPCNNAKGSVHVRGIVAAKVHRSGTKLFPESVDWDIAREHVAELRAAWESRRATSAETSP